MARDSQSGPRRLLSLWTQWVALAVCAALGFTLFTFVDLSPQVQADFFFASDDPQLQDSQQIEKEFGQGQQVFVSVASERIVSRAYLNRLLALTRDLQKVPGVSLARSLANGPQEPEEVAEEDAQEIFADLAKRPFWKQLLLAPDRSATFVVLLLDDQNQATTIAGIDAVLATHRRPDFELGVSGVPYVAEHVRLRLNRDLRVFSVAAFAAFAVVVGILFRSISVLMGTMIASLSASFATFLVRSALGMETDILAPNLWTIAFVLTLSHVVYLTAQWRNKARESSPEQAVRDAVLLTGPASAWSLAANLLGFASLVFVSAQPLRQFGISGGIAALAAIACAYGLFPPFLRSASPGIAAPGNTTVFDRFFASRHSIIAIAVLGLAAVLAPFAWRIQTDPSLPSYFLEGDSVRTGLEDIDRSSGSSSLDLVLVDARGRDLDNDGAYDRLRELQRRLEAHKDVGSVLSLALLMGEAERPWYSFLFSWDKKFDRLESPANDRIGRAFVSADRKRARILMRMHESARTRPRETIIDEVKSTARAVGFEPVLVGGLYPLQGELSKLVESSVVRGLGGLLALFLIIIFIVTRSFGVTLAMGACLAATPLMLFGMVGLLGMPVDIISAPAANVALPLGIDEMIHLGFTVRRLRSKADQTWTAWKESLATLWRPIMASMLIVVSGFSLFLFSSFPPTRRLGVLVCAGAAITDLVVLLVLPAVATWRRSTR